MTERILCIQLRRIGDVLMTTPAVRALRRAYPRAHIAFLTEAPADQVYRHSPHVDEVIVWPRKAGVGERLKAAWALRRRRFDAVLDFFGNPTSAQITRLTGAPTRVGFDFPGRRRAYTHRIRTPEGRRFAAYHKTLLLQPLGAEPDGLLPEIHYGEHEHAYAQRQAAELGIVPGDFVVALSPVSRQPYKVWPAQRFAAVADALAERYGAKILLFWGPGEEDMVDAVRAAMTHSALPGYPVPTLLEMAALLQRCDVYVGNDNGPRHFAVAVGTPTVAVFGRPHPENWTPPDEPRHTAVAYDPGCKAACTYPRCAHLACINEVPVQDVQTAAFTLIDELRHGDAVSG